MKTIFFYFNFIYLFFIFSSYFFPKDIDITPKGFTKCIALYKKKKLKDENIIPGFLRTSGQKTRKKTKK